MKTLRQPKTRSNYNLRHPVLLLLSIILSTACGTTPIKKHSEKIEVNSADFEFIDQLLTDKNQNAPLRKIDVWLTVPDQETFKPPYPAVVLLHSSWGLSSQEWYYANIFKRMGIATFAIDSFIPRGVEKTSLDQTRVSSASMLKDAYAVLNYLHLHPQFDGSRVAVMGFSKGGIVALYSAVNRIQNALSTKDQTFAAHIAYYPWCGLRLYNMQTTGSPILIQGGSKDFVTPINRCKTLVENELTADNASHVTIKEYRSARHAFDHPVLGRLPFKVAMDAQIPADCSIKEIHPGKFIEESTGTQATHQNIGEVLHRCSKYKGEAKYNRKAAREALKETQKFLKTYIVTK